MRQVQSEYIFDIWEFVRFIKKGKKIKFLFSPGLTHAEKVKAYLINGARHLRVESVYPNRTLGYGALCLEDSLPG